MLPSFTKNSTTINTFANKNIHRDTVIGFTVSNALNMSSHPTQNKCYRQINTSAIFVAKYANAQAVLLPMKLSDACLMFWRSWKKIISQGKYLVNWFVLSTLKKSMSKAKELSELDF
jgi:hypothetical protein